MSAARAPGVWLTAALVCGCANGGESNEPTWPQWRVPAPAPARMAAPSEPAQVVHSLPEGRLGLRPGAVEARPPSSTATDPWVEMPVHGRVFHYLAHVYEAPREGARAIGYMRRGSLLRAGEEAGRDGCAEGWYPVWGGGFVCRGQGYRLSAAALERGSEHPPPNRYDPLPYPYVKVVAPAAQTWRVPSAEEDALLHALVQAHLAAAASAIDPSRDAGVPAGDAGADAGVAAGLGGVDGGVEDGSTLPSWVRMIDEPGHYLSLAGEVQREDGRVFLRTVRGAFVPKDATLPVEAPASVGVALSAETALPVAIALRDAPRRAPSLDGSPRELPPLARGDAIALTGERRVFGKRSYLQGRDGSFVDAARVRVVEPRSRPALVPAGSRWVHVDTRTQTLTAYEDARPVYVALISTGKAGYETPEGLHRIHAKHVTATMDDTALSDGAYYIEDVPWTMYFEGSYALHAAFWHERFGRPRSHGCVNLAPADAHWLFSFLSPTVPGGRHGVLVPGARPSYVLVEASQPGASS